MKTKAVSLVPSEKLSLALASSEAVVAQMAAKIFAGYVIRGDVNEENEVFYIKKAIQIAFSTARWTDAAIRSDDETG